MANTAFEISFSESQKTATHFFSTHSVINAVECIAYAMSLSFYGSRNTVQN